MNDICTSTLANNIATSIASDYTPAVLTEYNGITCLTKLEVDSNELKINIKKFQIKFNFNL